jgi:hypothetical protein
VRILGSRFTISFPGLWIEISFWGQRKRSTLSVNEIRFLGKGNHVLTSDDQKVTYSAPQWKVKSHNYPISYYKKASMKIEAKFSLSFTPVGAVKVKMTGPEGTVNLPPTDIEKDQASGLWLLSETPLNGTLKDEIGFYGAQDPAKSFTMTWTLIVGGVEMVGETTNHTMYVTHAKPILGDSKPDPDRVIRQETVFYTACKNAAGKSLTKGDTQLDIGKFIFVDFQDRDLQKVVPTKSILDGIPMAYWGDIDGNGLPDAVGNPNGGGICQLGTALLADPDRNGACTAWMHLLSDTFRVHGFSTTRLALTPKDLKERRFVVNNVELDAPANLDPEGTNPLYAKYHYIEGINMSVTGKDEDDKVIPIGVPGQGSSRFNSDPAKKFGNHFILKFHNALFDPSYGSRVYENIAGQPPKDLLKEYEDENIALYALEIVGGNFPYIYRANKTDPASGVEIVAVPFKSDKKP